MWKTFFFPVLPFIKARKVLKISLWKAGDKLWKVFLIQQVVYNSVLIVYNSVDYLLMRVKNQGSCGFSAICYQHRVFAGVKINRNYQPAMHCGVLYF